MIKEAAAEDYTPIFANKGAGTAPVSTEADAKAGNGHGQGTNGGNGGSQMPSPPPSPSPYTWTPEAQERLDRVPAGFMRDCTRALIQKHAEKIGATTITLEVANTGIEQAKGTMEEAMKSGNLKDIIARLTGAGTS